MIRTFFQASRAFLRSQRRDPRRRSSRRPVTSPGERLERRDLLASHPGFVYDANDALVAVDEVVQAKMGDLLAHISAHYEAGDGAAGYSLPATTPGRDALVWGNGGEIDGVLVTAVALPNQTDDLAAGLAAIGGSSIVTYADHVSAVLPFAAIDDAAAIPSLRFADVVFESRTNAAISAITNQADIALLADAARARFGVDGTGIRVGVISDSFDVLGGYAFDVETGALPAGVQVLKEGPREKKDGKLSVKDEGRAMAQLVYSIAPGAELFFATGFGGAASFADSIRQLAAAGCQIIVDDVTEGGVPWFQDGIVAQAVNTVVEDYGVAYFTSAGNFARNSYAAEVRPVDAASIAGLPAQLTSVPGLVLHDFDPGPGVDVFQLATFPEGTRSFHLELQWDQPWGANQSDIDVFMYAADGVTLLNRVEGSHQTGGNPTLGGSGIVLPQGVTQVQFVIAHAGGVAPTFVKWVSYHDDLQLEYATASSTIVGHANSTTAAAVGASEYFRTPAYRESPALLADFSSWGGTPILFAEDGTRLPAAEVREQPRFVAPQFGNTSFFGQAADWEFDGLPNFSGTSAAAPNAAAVAALMMHLDPTLSAAEIVAALEATAVDMREAGHDFATGHGLIQAEAVLARVAGISISGTVFEDVDRDGRQDADEQPLAGATVFLDGNGNGRLDVAPAADAERRFVAFSVTGPVAIGIGTQLDNPNQPNGGPLQRPFQAVSPVDVTDLPGAITDLGVYFSLRSDQVIDGADIVPLFVTLVSPIGIRLPLVGTTPRPGGYERIPASGGRAYFGIPMTGTAIPHFVSRTETPISDFPTSDFLAGSGNSLLTQVDAAALVGTAPNGTWQLVVESNVFDSRLSATLESWELFLQTAEPQTTTDSQGRYVFEDLAPSASGGVYVPMLAPSSERLRLPSPVARTFSLGVGDSVTDASFAVTPARPAAPAVALAFDTGLSDTDRITRRGRLVVTGAKGNRISFSRDGGLSWSRSFQARRGVNEVQVRQRDAFGQFSESTTFSFVLVRGRPRRPLVSLLNDTGRAGDRRTQDSTLAFGHLVEAARVEYSVDRRTWTTTYEPAEGRNRFFVRQIDTAGNVSRPRAFRFVLDRNETSETASSNRSRIDRS